MKRIYVCSRLRGPDGQPSQANIERARKLMRAVFDAGHAPFAPHLLYPQVLTESKEDLAVSFKANFAFLNTCSEIWVDAPHSGACSQGMQLEVAHVRNMNQQRDLADNILIVFNPEEFQRVP